jgi:hypothetical protein
MKTDKQWKDFVEWIGSKGPYWFYDEKQKYWIGTPYELPTTEELWDIWKNKTYPDL